MENQPSDKREVPPAEYERLAALGQAMVEGTGRTEAEYNRLATIGEELVDDYETTRLSD